MLGRCLALLIAACAILPIVVASRKTIRVGVYFSLTGAGAATNGRESWDGFRFAVEKINERANASNYQLQVILCDDKFDLQIARQCWIPSTLWSEDILLSRRLPRTTSRLLAC